MGRETRAVVGTAGAASFDVVCAGEALWVLAAPSGAFSVKAGALRFRPGGGAVSAALGLAKMGLRVGLAAALGDDRAGRMLVAQIAAAGVDVAGVSFGLPRTGLVFVEGRGDARQVVSRREEEDLAAVVPAGWSSQVLLLSGLTPALPHAAALCKAARRARRSSTIVVVDVNARQHMWAGRDSRAIRSVLHEADVVRCSTDDLAVLMMDPAAVRAAMRPTAVLVLTDPAGTSRVSGAFGELAQRPAIAPAQGPLAAAPQVGAPSGNGDGVVASICADLARLGHAGAERAELWERALARDGLPARAVDTGRYLT